MKNILKKMIILSTIFIPNCIASGQLDSTFGSGGIVITSIGRTDYINSSTIQSDGKILVAGASEGNSGTRLVCTRYTTTGSLDSTFNGNGSQKIMIGSRTEGNAIALQADDKIVISGFDYSTKTNIATARLNTDGSLDSTFNGAGYIITSTGTGSTANTVALQSDGKIVVAGTAVIDMPGFALVRYNTDGTIDTTFGANGIVFNLIGYSAVINQIVIQSDSKIIAAGYNNDGSIIEFALARYNSDGSLDNTFGSGGIVLTAIDDYAIAKSVKLQGDGKIVVGGFTYSFTNQFSQFVVARYDSSGNLDTSFGSTGIVTTEIQNDAQANSIVIQTDGKIIAGGYSLGDSATQFALARYLTDGTLDSSYGTGGIVVTTIGDPNDSTSIINSVSLQPDGKCIGAGLTNLDFALARYTA